MFLVFMVEHFTIFVMQVNVHKKGTVKHFLTEATSKVLTGCVLATPVHGNGAQ